MRLATFAAVSFLMAVAACAQTPAAKSQAQAATAPVAELQYRACIGEKEGANVVPAADGKCLCYDPPWDAGVRPPDERERQARHDFDGFFLCRANAGVPPSTANGPKYCPVTQPTAGEACSAHDTLLRNGDCLYVGPDMKQLVYFRCDAERWRDVPEAEIWSERVSRP